VTAPNRKRRHQHEDEESAAAGRGVRRAEARAGGGRPRPSEHPESTSRGCRGGYAAIAATFRRVLRANLDGRATPGRAGAARRPRHGRSISCDSSCEAHEREAAATCAGRRPGIRGNPSVRRVRLRGEAQHLRLLHERADVTVVRDDGARRADRGPMRCPESGLAIWRPRPTRSRPSGGRRVPPGICLGHQIAAPPRRRTFGRVRHWGRITRSRSEDRGRPRDLTEPRYAVTPPLPKRGVTARCPNDGTCGVLRPGSFSRQYHLPRRRRAPRRAGLREFPPSAEARPRGPMKSSLRPTPPLAAAPDPLPGAHRAPRPPKEDPDVRRCGAPDYRPR
jgi:hypothetical protein